MKKIIMALIVIVMIGASVEWYIHLPKKLKVINIPEFSYVGELKVEDDEENIAHLYEGNTSYWVRYRDSQMRIRDIILSKKSIKKQKYTAVHIVDVDSCVLY